MNRVGLEVVVAQLGVEILSAVWMLPDAYSCSADDGCCKGTHSIVLSGTTVVGDLQSNSHDQATARRFLGGIFPSSFQQHASMLIPACGQFPSFLGSL